MSRRGWLPIAALVAVWLVLSTLCTAAFFLTSERTIDVASHEARVTPDLTGDIVVRTGPLLPDVRTTSGSAIGVEIELGKTDVGSLQQLTARYAAIGSNPEVQIEKVSDAVRDMAIDSIIRGLALGALPLLVWILLGERRRREIVEQLPTARGVASLVIVAAVVIGLTAPWRGLGGAFDERTERWIPLATFVGPSVVLPEELEDVEVLGDATTDETQRLIASAIDSYKEGRQFYVNAAEAASELDLRQPEDGETVVLLVSDRHDNVGMD